MGKTGCTLKVSEKVYQILLDLRGKRSRGGKTMSDVIEDLLPEDLLDEYEDYDNDDDSEHNDDEYV